MLDYKSSRTLSQLALKDKWIETKGNSCIEAATGYGKSLIAVFIIQEMNKRNPLCTTFIVVPTINLKNDWESKNGYINSFKLLNVEIYVLNSYIKEHKKCDLLIIDEVHNVLNNKSVYFSTAISITTYRYFLGLSATLEDKHKEFLKELNINILATITLKEAEQNGWISKYKILCVPISLNDEDTIYYQKLHSEFNKHFAMFNFNFETAMSCVTSKEARYRLSLNLNWDIGRVNASVFNWNRNMRLRKEFLYHVQSKLDAARNICKTLNLKTILFGESQKGAEWLTEELGNKCVTYHSKMKAKERKEALQLLYDGRTKVKWISSVKALTEGFDMKDLECGIVWSRTSTSLDATQRCGRVARFVEGKTAYIIELYIASYVDDKGKVHSVQDEKWLRKSLKRQKNILWLNSIEQIYQIINNHDSNRPISENGNLHYQLKAGN